MVRLDTYEDITNFRDKYYEGLPLMESPVAVILIVLFYLLFTLKIGPNYMKNRPAFNLNKFLMIYNVGIVVFSSYLFYSLVQIIWRLGLFDKSCTAKEDYNLNDLLHAGYCFFLTKVIELLDTVLFVLRKKQIQVSFLHVYHHSIMVLMTWIYIKYEVSYALCFGGTINTLVHIIMYTYYGLASIPAMRQYLWWKKYLTVMQLVQFGLIFVQAILFNMITKCSGQTNKLFIITCVNVILFIFLFLKFYRDTYHKNTRLSIDKFVCSNVNAVSDEDKML